MAVPGKRKLGKRPNAEKPVDYTPLPPRSKHQPVCRCANTYHPVNGYNPECMIHGQLAS